MQSIGAVEGPLATLLDGVLAGVCRDIPGALGAAVSIARPGTARESGQLEILAMQGIAEAITPITIGRLWGPALTAAREEEPVAAEELWNDPRWPNLTLDRVLEIAPKEYGALLSRVHGAAAMPSIWDDTGVVVLSVYLDRPADDVVLAILARHERLVTSAITIADVATRTDQKAEEILDALASRATIEQAKGAIMMLMRCDAAEAWSILRKASQEFNIKVKVLATALVEHIGQAPVQQPEPVVTDQAVNAIASLVLSALGMTGTASETRSGS